MKFGLLVCTRDRAVQLRACLESVVQMEIPDSVELHVVIVENARSSHCNDIVENFPKHSRIRFHHALCSKLGIPFARNEAVKQALDLEVDWLAFIDDDEVISRNWMKVFLAENECVEADIYHGPVDYLYELNPPEWMPLYRKKSLPNHQQLAEAATNNLILNPSLFKSRPVSQWFNQTMRFSGGTDTELTRRLTEQGAKAIWLENLLVYESVPPDRLSQKAIYRRIFRESVNLAHIEMKRISSSNNNRFLYLFSQFSINIFQLFIVGLVKLPIALLTQKLYKNYGGILHRRLCKCVRILGTIAGLSGYLGQVYLGDA